MLALQLGHRRSIDFDWLSEQPIEDPLQLASRLKREIQEFEVESVARETLHTRVRGVRSSFLTYSYPRLDPLVPWSAAGVWMASLRDIACMKLAAASQPGSRKDFVDLFTLDRHGLSLRDMLHWYQDRFETRDIGHVLTALAYFDDAEAEPMPSMLWKVTWDEVKAALRDRVRSIADEQ